ncbi:MAG: amino acid ABC transporter permease, partial [Cyanobacteria bacterium P01_G01_bin.49]
MILYWIKKNLFSTLFDSLLTVISSLLLLWISSSLFNWGFTQARWAVISDNLRLFFVGQYPLNLLWRPWTSLAIILASAGFSWGILTRNNPLFIAFNLSVIGILAALCAILAIPISLMSSLKLLGILILLIIAAYSGKQLGQKFSSLGTWLPF